MNAQAPIPWSIVTAEQEKQADRVRLVSTEQLGLQTRAERLRQGMTLKSLREKSGIATSTLSKIENNQISPSFKVVQQLMQALQVDLPQLFAGPRGAANLNRRSLTRRGEGRSHLTPTYEHRLHAGELSQKKMLPFTSTIRARCPEDFDKWVRHEGEEFFMVLRGSIELHSEYYEPVRLDAGDSGYFDSTMGHALISVGKDDAEVIWVVSLS